MAGRTGEIQWGRFQRVQGTTEGKTWLEIQHQLGLAPNTIEAYGRGLEDFLRWCESTGVEAASAGRVELASYVGDPSSACELYEFVGKPILWEDGPDGATT